MLCCLWCTKLRCNLAHPSSSRLQHPQTTYQEGTFAALAAAGAPREGPSYADADAAGAALAAVAPVGVTLYERQALQLKEGGAADTSMR